MNYSYKKEINASFEETLSKTKEALLRNDFGILTETNVKDTLKKKLNIDFDKYVILGACNPPSAHKALLAEKEVGLFLPCNVIVYQKKDSIFVSAILPTVAMSVIGNSALDGVSKDIELKLKKALDSIK